MYFIIFILINYKNNYDIVTIQSRFNFGPILKILNLFLLQFIEQSGSENHASLSLS